MGVVALPSSNRLATVREVEALARVHTRTAINTLLEVCESKQAPAAARVAAAEAILSRGWGKPKNEMATDSGGEGMSDEQLATAIVARLSGIVRGGQERPETSSAAS